MAQTVEATTTTAEQRVARECKGRRLALTRRIYRLLQTDVFYVESESTDNTYYFVKFKPDVVEYCSCPDNSMRGGQMKCKHLYAVTYSIRLGTLKDTDRLPKEAKRDNSPIEKKSAWNDNYGF